MQDAKLPGNRRDFLGMAAMTAATAAAAGLGSIVPVADAAAATGARTDFTDWLDSIPGKYRQVYDMPQLNAGMGLIWSWVFRVTAAQGYRVSESDLGVVVILRHDAIPLALADSAWAKYRLGEVFKIQDPKTGKPALRNAFYEDPVDGVPDAAIRKLIDAGVKIAGCNMAITHYSGGVAKSMGLQHEDVKKEWTEAVLPGIQIVPSGVLACNGAVSRDCVYVYAG
jgi:hypothetical protein